MGRVTDSRNQVGGLVHALAKHVTNETKAKALYGPNNWKTAIVNGVVLGVNKRTEKNCVRASKYVIAKFKFNDLYEKTAEVNIRSVKPGAFIGDGVLRVKPSVDYPELFPPPNPAENNPVGYHTPQNNVSCANGTNETTPAATSNNGLNLL